MRTLKGTLFHVWPPEASFETPPRPRGPACFDRVLPQPLSVCSAHVPPEAEAQTWGAVVGGALAGTWDPRVPAPCSSSQLALCPGERRDFQQFCVFSPFPHFLHQESQGARGGQDLDLWEPRMLSVIR